jgi:lipoprotein signal peptidase
VFNLADSAIVVAGVSLVVYALMGLEPEGREDAHDEDSTVGDADS